MCLDQPRAGESLQVFVEELVQLRLAVVPDHWHVDERRTLKEVLLRQPIAVSDISIYICLIDIRDGSSLVSLYMGGGLIVCRPSAQPKLAADHVSL